MQQSLSCTYMKICKINTNCTRPELP